MWLFNLLLRLYPAGFRAEYENTLRQAAREAQQDHHPIVFLFVVLSDFLAAWPALRLSELQQDALTAVRNWQRQKLSTTLAVFSLALATGVSTGVFSAVNTLLFQTLPFAKPHELVRLKNHYAPFHLGRDGVAQWVRQSHYLADSVSYATGRFQVGATGHPLHVQGAETTANFFRTLGTTIPLGRDFLPTEDIPGQTDVVILSHALFEQGFGGDRRLIGQPITIQHRKLTVVGIAPPAFDFPAGASFWTPKVFDWESLPKSGVTFLTTLGRLKPDLTLPAAQQALSAEAAPTAYGRSSTPEMRPQLISLREEIAGPALKSSLALLLAVSALVLIASANLAGYLLGRYAQRLPEFRTRLFLGAQPARLCQQILTECSLLAGLAAVLGVGISLLTIRWLEATQAPTVSFQTLTLLDFRVLAFASLTALVCGLLCGWLAWRGIQSPRPARAWLWRQGLVFAQVSLTVVLLGAAALLSDTVLQWRRADLGFSPHAVLSATVSLAGSAHEEPAASTRYLTNALEAARRLPGVQQVAAVNFLPLGAKGFAAHRFRLPAQAEPLMALTVTASPGFFSTLETPLLAGRDFSVHDHAGRPPVAIVNEAFARQHGGIDTILGRPLQNDPPDEKAPTVIGVARTMRFLSPEEDPTPMVFYSVHQRAPVFFTIVARGTPNPAAWRESLQAIDPKLPIYDITTLASRLDQALGRPQSLATTMGFFAAFSLGLTLLHLFGLCCLQIEQRRKELGIRLALGATAQQLRQLVLARACPPLIAGLAAGVALQAPARSLLWEWFDFKALLTSQTDAWAAVLLGLAMLVTLLVATTRLAYLNAIDSLKAD